MVLMDKRGQVTKNRHGTCHMIKLCTMNRETENSRFEHVDQSLIPFMFSHGNPFRISVT